MKTLIGTTMLAGSLLLATASLAGDCGYEFCWGAVGIGPQGEWGWANGYASENGAVAKVRSECPGCSVIETFYNTCGAMAAGSDGAYGFGWGPSRGGAEGNAVAYCSDYGAGCRPVVWSCSQ